MATVAELLVKIGGDSSGLQKEINASQRQLKRAFGSEALGMSEKALDVLGALAAAMGVVGLAAIKMSSDFKVAKTSFATLLGSAEKATQLMDDLATFAAETPFQLPELIQSSKQLLAFQFAAEDIIPIMNAVGNAISLVGGGEEGINSVVRALGQIQAKGKLLAEEMNQLAERGINGWTYVADAMGISTAEVMDLCQQGAVDATTAINAIVLGMQKNFKGGIESLSKEIPGLLSTIKDNAGAVLREVGEQLSDAFNIQGILTSVSEDLTTFANAVKSCGLKEAIQGLISPEIIINIFEFAGALGGAAVAAIYLFRGALIKALVPLAPFIAAGAAVGLLAYEIWNNWVPLCDLFSALWETVTDLFFEAWNDISAIVNDNFGWVIDYLSTGWDTISTTVSDVWNAIPGWIDTAWSDIKGIVGAGVSWVTDAVKPLLDLIGLDMPSGLTRFFDKAANGLGKIKKATDGFNLGLNKKDILNLISTPQKPNTNFTGLHNKSGQASSTGSKSTKDKKSEEEKAWDKLVKKAEDAHKEIYDQWVQTTQDELAQLDVWKKTEQSKLDESKEANGNYQNDIAMLESVYSAKRIKIIQNEAKEKLQTFKSIRDGYLSIQKELTLGSLSGSAKDIASKDFDLQDKIKSVKDHYQDIENNYNTGTKKQQADITDSLNKLGIDYQISEANKLDLSKVTADNILKYQLNSQKDRKEYYRQFLDVQKDLDEAYNNGNLQDYKKLLDSKGMLDRQWLTGAQSFMNEYTDLWKIANATIYDNAKTLMGDVQSSLTDCLVDFTKHTSKASDIFKNFANSVIDSIIKMQAQAMAANAVTNIFGGLFGGVNLFGSAPAGIQGPVGSNGGFFSNPKGRWSGGPVVGGQPYLVGEQRAEIFVPSSSGRIIPNTNALSGGGSSQPNIQVNITNNTGNNISSDNTNVKFDGRKFVIDVVLDAANRNVNGFKNNLKSVLGGA